MKESWRFFTSLLLAWMQKELPAHAFYAIFSFCLQKQTRKDQMKGPLHNFAMCVYDGGHGPVMCEAVFSLSRL